MQLILGATVTVRIFVHHRLLHQHARQEQLRNKAHLKDFSRPLLVGKSRQLCHNNTRGRHHQNKTLQQHENLSNILNILSKKAPWQEGTLARNLVRSIVELVAHTKDNNHRWSPWLLASQVHAKTQSQQHLSLPAAQVHMKTQSEKYMGLLAAQVHLKQQIHLTKASTNHF
jgi:hypothetical protein